MSGDVPLLDILVAWARALARTEGVGPRLEAILRPLAEHAGIASAVIFATTDDPDRLDAVAWVGLPEPALGALVNAVRDPGHPIVRTARDHALAFDVAPTAPGGPALRSHLPLVLSRAGRPVVVGVLALAHEEPVDAAARSLLVAAADLAAVALEIG